MAWFKFIGDPAHGGEGPDDVTMHGRTFGRANATEVTDPVALRKLHAHSHFAQADGAATATLADVAATPPASPRGRTRKRRSKGEAV